jgi:hypothetical protein
MFPQLSKSHTSLIYRNTFPRDCVTVAKFNSNDNKYDGLDEITKLPTAQYIGPRLVYRSGTSCKGKCCYSMPIHRT